MGAGVVIADDAGFSDVEITGSTISDNDMGIAVATDSAQEIRFSNIVNNDYGVTNEGVGTPDAIYNWWGHASGPLSVTNPFGEGNPVSDDVDFDPWLESASVTQTVENAAFYAEEAATLVDVHGKVTVTISRYSSNPYPEAPIGGEGEGELASLNAKALQTDPDPVDIFIDVYVTNFTVGTWMTIQIYYTEEQAEDFIEDTLRAWWYNEDTGHWFECSNSDVVTSDQHIGDDDYSGYIWALVRDDNTTTPDMAQLDGDTFGGYGSGAEPPTQGCGGCSIATAAYGTDTAEQLDILREFRDTVLLPNRVGAGFVSLYYSASPHIADFISRNEVHRTIARVGFVDPLVRLLTWTQGLWSP
jgi:hypothetical protein